MRLCWPELLYSAIVGARIKAFSAALNREAFPCDRSCGNGDGPTIRILALLLSSGVVGEDENNLHNAVINSIFAFLLTKDNAFYSLYAVLKISGLKIRSFSSGLM
jgi:hypothetical protein